MQATYEKEIKSVIAKYLPLAKYQTLIFGSRAKGNARKWSDFDIGIIGETHVPLRTLGLINEALENSNIPFKVDVVDFSRVPEKFKMTEITNEKEKLQSLFASFQKALGRLEETVKLSPTSVHKDATIQRFEFTFELAWKLMQSTAKYQGFEAKSPRESIRVAAQFGLIYDPEEWFGFLEARNLTAHTYDEPIADEVYQKAKEFLKAAKDFCEEVKKQVSRP